MLQLSVLILMLVSVCSAPKAAPATDPRCQNATTIADILSTGEVNLLRFGAFGDGVTDDDDTLRSAIGCHNRVFIPAATHWPTAPAKGTPAYLINSTVVLADSDPCPRCPRSVGQVVQLRGVGQHATPASVLRTHKPSPVIQVGDWEWKYSTGAKVTLQDLAIDAVRVGVLIVATSDVHLVRVSIKVTEWGERGPPEVVAPKEDHAALVAVEVYWLYIDGCNFVGATPPGYDGQHNTSKRPSVIFRGQDNPRLVQAVLASTRCILSRSLIPSSTLEESNISSSRHVAAHQMLASLNSRTSCKNLATLHSSISLAIRMRMPVHARRLVRSQ